MLKCRHYLVWWWSCRKFWKSWLFSKGFPDYILKNLKPTHFKNWRLHAFGFLIKSFFSVGRFQQCRNQANLKTEIDTLLSKWCSLVTFCNRDAFWATVMFLLHIIFFLVIDVELYRIPFNCVRKKLFPLLYILSKMHCWSYTSVKRYWVFMIE